MTVALDIQVEPLSPSACDEWTCLVKSSPHGTVYALPEYLDALCTAAGGRYVVLGARRRGQLLGGVAVCESHSVYGPYVAPRPLLYYNGPVLRASSTRYPSETTARDIKVLTALADGLSRRGYARLTLAGPLAFEDARPFLAAGWAPSVRYTYVIDIADTAAQWGRVEQNFRRLVQRCEREGLVCVESDEADVLAELHEQTMSRKGGEVYLPPARFRSFLQAVCDAGLGRLFHARQPTGRTIASQLVLLSPGGVCHVAAAAADVEFLRTGASAFLRWKACEKLSTDGYRAVDLTDAALNKVTHFKSQLGGDLRPFIEVSAPPRLLYRLGSPVSSTVRQAKRALAGLLQRAPEGRSA
jgi:hypothetical protein